MTKQENSEKEELIKEEQKDTVDTKKEKTDTTAKKATSKSKKSAGKKSTHAKEDGVLVKIKEMEEKNRELQDKYLRLSAEFDNYRKRTLREKAELTKTASADLLSNILPVMDDFERGIQNIEQAKDIAALKEGVLLIYNKFKEFLNQNGVKEIEATHKEFDIDLHEAITKIPAPEKELKGKVVDVVQKGYLLNDKVLRFVKVVVGE
jgi:molecular chaperone GrpE